MPTLVSIVIPCYRGAAFLPAAIESCLAQTHRELEIIVVDDASPDDCTAIAERYAASDARVHLLRRPKNGGVAEAFNTGFNSAKGDMFLRLAQDDQLHVNAVECLLGALRDHPHAGLVYSDQQALTTKGEIVSLPPQPGPDEALRHGNKLGLCVMWRREVWSSVGCFDPRFRAAEDYDYWCRVAERFTLVHVPAVLITVRFHSAMGSVQRAARQEVETARVKARYARSIKERHQLLALGFNLAGHASRKLGRFNSAIMHFLRAIAYEPMERKHWRGLMGTMLRRGRSK